MAHQPVRRSTVLVTLAQSLVGLFLLLAFAWLLSERRRAIPPLFVLSAIALHVALALTLLKIEPIRHALLSLNVVVDALQSATKEGTAFVFGYLGGASAPYAIANPQGLTVLAFQVLPLVIVVSALSALLWHWKILPLVVRGFSLVLERTLKIGGAVGFSAAADVFVGMIEAPLLIRPYLARLSRGELFGIMSVGLATVAGTVLVIYATLLEPVVSGAIGHILVASVLNVPAALLFAKILVPDDGATPVDAAAPAHYASAMDAVARGTEEGLKLYLSIVAMLIVVLALVKLSNILLGVLPPVGGAALSFERIAGWLFAPLVWCAGIPLSEVETAGRLMGVKTVLNEFIAYLNMAALPAEDLSPRSKLIMIYALCGFANFGSVGMMIAAISAMVPERRELVVALSLKAIVSGTLATLFTGGIVGLLSL